MVSRFVAQLALLCCVCVVGGCDSNSQTDNADPNLIGQGTLVSNSALGNRFSRFDFFSRSTDIQTIAVKWDGDADIRFNVLDSSGEPINSTVIQGSNPGIWTGELIENDRYTLAVWSVEDSANLTATFKATLELTTLNPISTTRYSDDADPSTWVLDGPANTLDYKVGENTDGWGRALLRVGDLLLVGGDFGGIKPQRESTDNTLQPWLTAFDAITGEPVTRFETPGQINSVVRSLVMSPDGSLVYAGGDFGLVAMDATTGAFKFQVPVVDEGTIGRIFGIAVSDTHLYIGGDFSQIDNSLRNNLARLSLLGELDSGWSPSVAGGISRGRSAPVQALTLSSNNNILYVGGTYTDINGTPVARTEQYTTVSMLAISTENGSVNAERFVPDLVSGEFEKTKDLIVHDIVVFDTYIIIAWGGPNYLTLHQADGARLQQYASSGDVHAISILNDIVIVGHHGEFFGTINNPIPPAAVESIDPLILEPFKLHTFRMDSASGRLTPEQTWPIQGAFGVWAIGASEDSLWIAGNLKRAGANGRDVEGLARFPAL